EQIIEALRDKAIPEKAVFFPRFFKTGPGEYGEGDLFLGVTVPDQRAIAKQFFKEITLDELSELIQDRYREIRLTALIALVYRYEKSRTETDREELANFYLHHLEWVNNWDLVDTSSHAILGHFYINRDKDLFFDIDCYKDLWRQRVA